MTTPPTIDEREALLPCPFCGRAPDAPSMRASHTSHTGELWTLSCFDGGYAAHVWIHGSSLAAVTAAWNTRDQADALRSQLAGPWVTRESSDDLVAARHILGLPALEAEVERLREIVEDLGAAAHEIRSGLRSMDFSPPECLYLHRNRVLAVADGLEKLAATPKGETP